MFFSPAFRGAKNVLEKTAHAAKVCGNAADVEAVELLDRLMTYQVIERNAVVIREL